MKQTTWGKDYDQLTPISNYRSEFITDVIKNYAKLEDSILEIGAGAGRNLNYLYREGFHNLTALDADIKQLDRIENKDIKIINKPIQELDDEKQYDIILCASVLYLIPYEDNQVFEKIEKMYKKYLIIVEGELCDDGRKIYGRDYSKIFKNQVEHRENIFNRAGHLRVFKKKWII